MAAIFVWRHIWIILSESEVSALLILMNDGKLKTFFLEKKLQIQTFEASLSGRLNSSCCLPCNNFTWVVGRNFGLCYWAAFYALQGVPLFETMQTRFLHAENFISVLTRVSDPTLNIKIPNFFTSDYPKKYCYVILWTYNFLMLLYNFFAVKE